MDLQLFGSNDTITSSQELKLNYKFADDDTRLTTLPNPKSDLVATDIEAVAATLYETQAFVGDKDNGAFATITSAAIVQKRTTKFDLSK